MAFGATVSEFTVPLALGLHARAAPLARFTATTRLRVCPPMLVNAPHTYIVLPERTSAFTVLFAVGFQNCAVAVAESRAATNIRVEPPIVLKLPPAYTSPPESTIE